MKTIEEILKSDLNAPVKSYKKGTIIQQAGTINVSTFYVKKGLLRSYIIDSKGKEHIYMFAPEDWIIADIEALEFNEPATLYIDCLEDSEIILFDKDCLFQEELDKSIIIQNAKLLSRRLGKLQRRVLMQMGSPAIDRYTYFLKIYPGLSNRIPQHMIATYLGIMPQTLSTIKSHYSKQPK